jgi:serine/threonine protein phosphatase PrpC
MKSGTKINSGSCATILIIKDNLYWAANVGDSRILLIKNIE